MSAKLGAITQRMPKSVNAQGACSRLEPQPKLSPATMILACRYGPWFSTKSGFSEPSGRKRISSNKCFASPVRLIVRRWIAGKILSVSMLIIGIGAATPVNCVNLSMLSFLEPLDDRLSVAEKHAEDGDRRRSIDPHRPEQGRELAFDSRYLCINGGDLPVHTRDAVFYGSEPGLER